MELSITPPNDYIYPTDAKTPNVFQIWNEFPPKCVNLSNYVTRAKLNQKIDILKFTENYPFCQFKSKNWGSVSLSTIFPFRYAVIYTSGMINFSGNSDFRTSRVIAERYVKMIQDIGYKDIEIINFRLVNITCGMGLDFIMDVKQYNKSRKDTLRTKNDFAGSRHLKLASTLVSGASVTVFKEKINIVGTARERDVCFDLARLYETYIPFEEIPEEPTAPPEPEIVDTAPKKRRITRYRNRHYKKLKI